jgi:ubiquinol-cytochrome c reductase cytochrome b subunit
LSTTTTTTELVETKKSGGLTAVAANYIDERTSISTAVKELGRKIFPDHWSFLLGEVALYSFVIILLSGSFLTFFFSASMAPVQYDGSFVPLKGVEMSAAMSSSLDISFDIRGGLLMRQVHHWAALLFVAAIGLHMLGSTSPAPSESPASLTG